MCRADFGGAVVWRRDRGHRSSERCRSTGLCCGLSSAIGRLATARGHRSSRLSRRPTACGDQRSRVRRSPGDCNHLRSQLRRPPFGNGRRTNSVRRRTNGLPRFDRSDAVVGARDRPGCAGDWVVGPRHAAPCRGKCRHPSTHLCDLTKQVQNRRIGTVELRWKVRGVPAESAASVARLLRYGAAIRQCGRPAHSFIMGVAIFGIESRAHRRCYRPSGQASSVVRSSQWRVGVQQWSNIAGEPQWRAVERARSKRPASVLARSAVGLMECVRPSLPEPAPNAGGFPPSRCSRWWRRWAWRSPRWPKGGQGHRCRHTSRRRVRMDTTRTTKPRARRVRRGPFREPHRVPRFRRWTTSSCQRSSAARSIASSRVAFTSTPIRARLPR